MIFVPSVDGNSYTEDEYTDWDDVVMGTNVLLHSILEKDGTAQAEAAA